MAEREIKVGDSFVVVRCAQCGRELNRTNPMPLADIRRKWALLVMSAPLNTGACPGGCRSTYSDCNANTEMQIVGADGCEITTEEMCRG